MEKGFIQRKGIDQKEVYTPVIRTNSCKVIFAKAAKENLEIMQFYVKTTFLYKELQENIWIDLPNGRQKK